MKAIERLAVAAALGLTVLTFPAAEAGLTPAGSSALFTLAPCRVIDTRDTSPIDDDDELVVTIAGQCGVPLTGALSATMNVTVVDATSAGAVSVSDSCCPEPVVHFAAGQTRANSAVVRISAAGTITVDADLATASDSVHVLLDVSGYFLENQPPLAVDDAATVAEDAAATTIDVQANDSDPDGPPGTIVSAVTQPANGTVAITNAGADLAYEPDADYCNDPPGSSLDTFTYSLQPGGSSATVSVTVTCVNDAPAGTDNAVATPEDTEYLFATADFGFTDPVDTPANALLAVKITTLPGAGSLTLSGGAVVAGQDIAVADITAGNLRFTPAADATGTPYAGFTFQVQDDGGTAGGGVDLDASANTLTVNVSGANDAPAGTDKTVTTIEDTDYVFATADFGFSDPNDTPADDLLAVKVTTLTTTGSLTLSGGAVSAGQSIAAADIISGNLKFSPLANASGSPYTTFSFQVQDDGGTAGGGVDLDAAANTMTIDVTAVNDAPAGTDDTVTTTEDTDYGFASSDFGLTDVVDTPANALLAVKITSLPGAGSFTLAGEAVVAGEDIAVADLTAGSFKFTPAADASGSPYATFTFQVRDDGGTADGGVDLDPSANTLTIEVTAVNDAPAGTDGAVTGDEDVLLTFTAADFGFTDPLDNPGDALQSVVVTTLPGAGSLTLSGSGFAAGSEISAADISSGNLQFLGAANAYGSPYTAFTFQVRDDGGIADGGVDLDASANTMTIHLDPVNDAPEAADETFEVIGNTELRVDMSAGATPHAGATTTGVSSYEGVLDNDGDLDGDTVTITAVGSGCGDPSAPFDCTLADGAVVHVDANGEFSYTPGPGDTAGGFEYTITDQPAVGTALSDIGTVTFSVVEMVWYVDNSAAPGTGTSVSPLNALTCAAGNIADGGNDPACTVDGDLDDDADGPDHYIFIDFGNGTASGLDQGLALENGQRLIGEFAGLSIPVDLNGNGSPTILQAAPGLTDCDGGPCRPLLDDTLAGGPSGVNATGVIPAEIVGLDLAGNDNAIEWTTVHPFAGTGSATIRDNVVRAAANQGIQVDLAGVGAVGLRVHDNTLTAGGTALDVFEHGTGSLTISALHDNVVTGASAGAGIDIFGVVFDSDAAAGIQPVAGGTTAIGDAGDRIGGAGLTLWLVSGALDLANAAVPASGIGAGDLDVYTDSGAALDVIELFAGTFDLDVTDGAGVLFANDGPAAVIVNADVELELASLTSSGDTAGVSLSGVSGTFAAAAGSITKAGGGGTAFTVGASSATVSYGGALNVSAGAGVALTNNTGAVSFTGVLTLATGADAGFSAIGSSGTVTATNAANTIATTTGAALFVNGPDLGAGGLVFQSISANGASTGILLQDTGATGGLTVTGTASTDGSGGTIQNITNRGASFINAAGIALANMSFTNVGTVNGADPTNPASACGDLGAGGGGNLGCNAGIHAQGVSGLTLTNLDLNGGAQQGINGSALTNFTLAGSVVQNFGNQTGEDGLHLRNLLGTSAITDSTLTGNHRNQVRIQNGSGTLTDLAITGSVFENPGVAAGLAEHGIFFTGHTLAAMKVSITGCTFQDLPGAGFRSEAADSATMEVSISGSGFQDLGSSAIAIAKAAAANVKYEISGNPTFLAAGSHVIDIDQQASSTSGSVLQGLLDGNVIGDAGLNSAVDPALCGACDGIRVRSRGAGATIANITNNSVRGTSGRGISAELSASTAANRLDTTIAGNTVELTDAALNDHAVLVQAGLDGTGDDGVACADVAGNTAGSVDGADDGIHVRQRERVELRMPGYTGGLIDAAAVIAYLQGRNPLTVDTVGASAIPAGDPTAGFLNTAGPGDPCAQPVLPP